MVRSRVSGFSRTALRLAIVAACLAVPVACAVTESFPVLDANDRLVGCESELGSYALPRQVLDIKIEKVNDDFVLMPITLTPIADNRHIYCLDHLRSPFADDFIRVHKNKIVSQGSGSDAAYKAEGEDTPFLQLVASKAVDHTAGIIRNFIRAAFILISNNPDFLGARSSVNLAGVEGTVIFDDQIDPFDFREMAEMNQSIRRFGFCFLLENYTYDRNATPVSAYCDAPGKMAYEHSPPAATAIASMRFHVPKPSSGIFYRPKAPYQLQVYTKHYPDDRGEWELSYTKKFEMENIMPVISVGIGRAVFATRRTGLVFDNGLLANVCIAKGSEIAGAIEIPLDIIYGLVALPGEIIRATYNDAETRRDLIRAETELINAQKEYIDFLNSQTKAQAVTKKPSTLSLGTPNDRRAPPGTDPVDPGSIVGSDALKDICPQLMAAKSLPGKGNF